MSRYEVTTRAVRIKLDANEHPYGVVPELRERLAMALAEVDPARYPDASASGVRALLGRHLGVDAHRIVVGSGSNEVMACVAASLRAEVSQVVIPCPTFGMYRVVAGNLDLPVVELVLEEGDGRAGAFGVRRIECASTEERLDRERRRHHVRIVWDALRVEVLDLVAMATTEAAIAPTPLGDEPVQEVVCLLAVVDVVGAAVVNLVCELVGVQVRHREQCAALVVPALLDEEQWPNVDRRAFDRLLKHQVEPPVVDRDRLEDATTHPVPVVPARVLSFPGIRQGVAEDADERRFASLFVVDLS